MELARMKEINQVMNIMSAVSSELSNALSCEDEVAVPMLARATSGLCQAYVMTWKARAVLDNSDAPPPPIGDEAGS